MPGKRIAAASLCAGAALAFAAVLFSPVGSPQQQTAAAAAPAEVPAVYASPALDKLASNLAVQIAHNKMHSVVVLGVLGNERAVTKLGGAMLDAFTAALSRQSRGVKVIDSAALREFLRQQRISEDMIYSDVLAPWIVEGTRADGFVTTHLETLESGSVLFGVQLAVLHSENFDREPWIKTKMDLSDAQMRSADQGFEVTSRFPLVQFGSPGFASPECIACPKPEYSHQAREMNIIGVTRMMFTVRPDGVTDEVYVARALGYGMDVKAVNAVLAWKFKPAADSQGHPVAMRMLIDVTFAPWQPQ